MAELRTGRISRTTPLVGLAGRTAGEAVVTALRRKPRSEQAHERSAARYAERLGNSRGVLMKAGQILSFVTFAEAVDDRTQTIYQRALARLQDDAPAMPPETAKAIVDAELGPDAFAAFSPEPIAAASIGQVHTATLPDGRRVAVKLQYPGVDQAVRADLANTELLATFLSLARGAIPQLAAVDIRAIAREVAARIGEEIDYVQEARNQQEFADAYRGHPFIRIPEIVPSHSTARVLTMDLVEGMRFKEAVLASRELRDLWGEAINRFSFGSLRRLRLFNADPHPGNYLFHEDGTVTFLDFGCVRRYEQHHISWLVDVLEAAAEGDAHRIREAYLRGGWIDPADPPDAEELMHWNQVSFRPLLAPQPFTYTRAYATEAARNGYIEIPKSLASKITVPSEMTMLSRIDLGLCPVFAALECTGPWNDIRLEWDAGGPPATEYGRLEKEFWS